MAVKKRHGVWHVDFQYQHPATGARKRHRASTGHGTTKKEAIELEHRLRRELETLPTQKVECRNLKSFSEFAQHWLETYEANLKPSTLRSYEMIVRVHLIPYFKDKNMREISREQIEAYKAKKVKVLHPKTVNNHLGVMSCLFGCALDWRYLEHNPYQGIKMLKVPPAQTKFWTHEQSTVFLRTVKEQEPYWHVFFLTALHTGMRLGELTALTWDDVDFTQGYIHVQRSHHRGHLTTPKNGRARFVPMSDDLKEALRQHRHLKALVFCTEDGNYLTRDMVKRPFARLTEAAGLLQIRFHDLRHSFASQLTMMNTPQLAVQHYLGHSDPKMTARYSHLSSEADHAYVNQLNEKVWARFGHAGPKQANATSEN